MRLDNYENRELDIRTDMCSPIHRSMIRQDVKFFRENYRKVLCDFAYTI